MLEDVKISKVHQLILDDPLKWNVQLLSNMFSDQYREEIEKISLTIALENLVY